MVVKQESFSYKLFQKHRSTHYQILYRLQFLSLLLYLDCAIDEFQIDFTNMISLLYSQKRVKSPFFFFPSNILDASFLCIYLKYELHDFPIIAGD